MWQEQLTFCIRIYKAPKEELFNEIVTFEMLFQKFEYSPSNITFLVLFKNATFDLTECESFNFDSKHTSDVNSVTIFLQLLKVDNFAS